MPLAWLRMPSQSSQVSIYDELQQYQRGEETGSSSAARRQAFYTDISGVPYETRRV